MAERKITPDAERDITAKAAEGWTTRRIAAWLKEAHGISVSHEAVAKLLRQTRETRADVAAAVTREALRPHVVSDLDRLEEIRAEAAERRARALALDDCSHLDYVRLAQLEADLLDRKLKLAGANQAIDTKPLVSEDDVRRMAEVVLGKAD